MFIYNNIIYKWPICLFGLRTSSLHGEKDRGFKSLSNQPFKRKLLRFVWKIIRIEIRKIKKKNKRRNLNKFLFIVY